jgi:hypothetical protein
MYLKLRGRLQDKKKGQYTKLNTMNNKGNRRNKTLSICFSLSSFLTDSLAAFSAVIDMFDCGNNEADDVLFLRYRITARDKKH